MRARVLRMPVADQIEVCTDDTSSAQALGLAILYVLFVLGWIGWVLL